ncbi:pentatricopeptide repeat-containing protein [Pyrus ussuriensis x Pyrus communis]|uniref:Pentatricopeptide repeat-containing protein n=1 Tax=Pyrus ussuriensis x Pyrus communis TaxID=2448454 RepID=A0A5N5GHA9_9ROSA|nr:pentatricopeptide repeat-containing protein [Pyrus ussuriensis x Pyrus communis]
MCFTCLILTKILIKFSYKCYAFYKILIPILYISSRRDKNTPHNFFATKLNALYAKYESLGHARKVFDQTPHRTVYLWNAMLRSYCREDLWQETLCLFRSMMSESRGNDEKPDNFTIPIALKACARLRALSCGKIIHGFVKKHEGVALDMFNGDPEEALEFLSRMVMVGHINPDRVTLVSAVSACAQLSNFRIGSCVHGVSIRNGFNSNLSLGNALLNLYAKTACALAGNLEEGKKIHEIATRKCFELDVKVATALIDMYMKCSALEKAGDLFDRMPEKDVVSWAALLSGGSIDNVVLLFEGITDKDVVIWSAMIAGELDKAMEIVERMPNPAGPHVWGALLGACWIHNNTKLGEVAAKSLFRTLIKEKGLKKMSGQSIVEVGSDIRSFVAGDRLHLDSDQIYGVLGKLEAKMREDGYVPNVDLLLHDMADAV